MQFLPLGVVAQSTRRIQKCYVRCQVRQNQNHWGPRNVKIDFLLQRLPKKFNKTHRKCLLSKMLAIDLGALSAI